MGDDLPAMMQLLSSLADGGFARTVLGALAFTVLSGFAGIAVGLVLGTTVATPALRWGFGRAGVWGCVATVLMVVGGLAGFLWAGAWIGGGRAVVNLIEDRLLVEELALRALVTSASSGDADLSTEELAARLATAFETGDGAIQEILDEIDAELRSEDPDGDLQALVPRRAIEEALVSVRDRGLADPGMLARVWSSGGFVAARDSGNAELAAFVDRLLGTTASMRAEIARLVHASVWPTALPGALAGVLAPLSLVVLVAAFGRWWRRSTPA